MSYDIRKYISLSGSRLQENRSKYYPAVLVAVAVLTVALLAHGRIFISRADYFSDKRIPQAASMEIAQFTAATQFASGHGLALTGDLAQFPETVKSKMGKVPACSPAYMVLLSIPAKWASMLTPSPENIKVSATLDAGKAAWERNYLNFVRRHKLTVIFFQGPFLLLLLLCFYTASKRFLPSASARLWLTIGLCFGTLAYPFALTINPIFPTAVMLLCGMHYLWRFADKPDIPDGVAAGLFLGAAILFNHLAYIPALVMIIAIAVKLKEPERLLPIIGGMIPGIALFAYSHFAIFGDPLPAIYHRGGGDTGLIVVWKYLIWSLLGYNGAIWMAPAVALALVYSFAVKKKDGDDFLMMKRGIGIAACLLLLVVALEGVFTFEPLIDPSTDAKYADAYSASRAASPQLEVNLSGFPISISFHTMIFGGEALALIGPCLLLVLSGVFATTGAWRTAGGIMLRVGIFIGIFAAHNPLGGRVFPLAENIHLLGFEIAFRFPREAIF